VGNLFKVVSSLSIYLTFRYFNLILESNNIDLIILLLFLSFVILFSYLVHLLIQVLELLFIF